MNLDEQGVADEPLHMHDRAIEAFDMPYLHFAASLPSNKLWWGGLFFTLGLLVLPLFLPRRSLPLIYVSAMIRTGSIYEPVDKVGLASLTGTVLRTGGTAGRTGGEIDELASLIVRSLAAVGFRNPRGLASLSIFFRDIVARAALSPGEARRLGVVFRKIAGLKTGRGIDP